ncbi:hypothetical protein [Nocardia farcinica]|uniref:hypothetical protein n=1 Tax=Nocardia farcinica TaxID=37329 RepID=UPI003CC7C836
MADEANPTQETTIDAAVTTDTAAVENPPETGGDDRATDTTADESKPADAKPEGKTFDEAYVKKLRDEAAANRVKGEEKAAKAAKEAAEAAEKALTEKLAKALGLVEEETPDPAALLKAAEEQAAEVARERDAYAEKLRNLLRKDAISEAAKTVDGDLAAILDSRKIASEIENLDTAADDFAAQVAAIVKDAVDSNPKLKKTVQVAAPRSGGDNSGGNAAPRRGPRTVDEIRRELREKRERDGF